MATYKMLKHQANMWSGRVLANFNAKQFRSLRIVSPLFYKISDFTASDYFISILYVHVRAAYIHIGNTIVVSENRVNTKYLVQQTYPWRVGGTNSYLQTERSGMNRERHGWERLWIPKRLESILRADIGHNYLGTY